MSRNSLTCGSATRKNQKSAKTPQPAGLNTRRYFWLILGYYLCSVYIKAASGTPDGFPSELFTNPSTIKQPESIPGHEEHEEERGLKIAKVDFAEVETPFIIALWIFCASLAKIGFHMAPKLSHIFPESCLLIVVGVVIGLLLFHTNSVHVQPLTPKTFFHYMLPPIILDAGYFMPNRMFFNNLGTILMMAVVGTIWNVFSIGFSLYGLGLTNFFGVELPLLQTLLFSSLISAVDPVAVLAVFEEIHVNEILYIVVFGESLLNDAVTVVLYHMFEEYAKMGEDQGIELIEIAKGCASFPVVALGGTAIGIIWGFLTGFVTRFTNHVRVIEPIFIFVMAYLAYLCAETFHMSGILAITFCGITMKNYVEANISQKSHTTVKYAMKMMSSSSETIIFMFLGVSTIHDDHEWNWTFIMATIFFCTVYRVIGTVVLSAICNRMRLHKLSKVDQFVMSYGGLRGAVAFALVLLIEDDAVNYNTKMQRMFVTTTITVIYFTVFLQGITIKPLVQWLKVKKAFKRELTMNERIHERLFDHTMAGLESLMGQVGHYNLRDKFKKFDNAYIRPCLIRDLKGAEPKILETYDRLTMKDAMEAMNKNPTASNLNLNKLTSESMAALIRAHTNGANNMGSGQSTDEFSSLPNQDTLHLDLQELEYNLSRKDMSDAKIHHLLAEGLYKPQRRLRRLSYSRHAVDENDLVNAEFGPQKNFKQQMNFKKMVCDKVIKGNKGRRTGNLTGTPSRVVSNGRVTFGEEYDNLGFTMAEEQMQNAENGGAGDMGIYFIAGGGSNDFHKSEWNERRWSQSSCSSAKSFMETAYPHVSQPLRKQSLQRKLSRYTDYDDTPTVTEVTLPWRRDNLTLNSSENATGKANSTRFKVSPARRLTRDEDGYHPTSMEATLPWKRDEESDHSSLPVRQQEFPPWATSKEYLAYYSPTNTYLGGIGGQPKPPHVLGIFKRDSMGSGTGSRRDSLQSQHQLRMDSPRHSLTSEGSGGGGIGGGGGTSPLATTTFSAGDALDYQPPGTPTGLLSGRRGSSFIGMAIPEVSEENERDSHESDNRSNASSSSRSSNSNSPKGEHNVAKKVGNTSSSNKFTVETTESGSPSKSPLEKIDEADDFKSSGSDSRKNSEDLPVEATNLNILNPNTQGEEEEGKDETEKMSTKATTEEVASETKL